jgi:hypothetical protein
LDLGRTVERLAAHQAKSFGAFQQAIALLSWGFPRYFDSRACAVHEFIFEFERGRSALSRPMEGTMAMHFGLKATAKVVKKPKESPKVYSPASWRGKLERRALSTR